MSGATDESIKGGQPCGTWTRKYWRTDFNVADAIEGLHVPSQINLRTWGGGIVPLDETAHLDLTGLLGDGAGRAEEVEAVIVAGFRRKVVALANLATISSRIGCDATGSTVWDGCKTRIGAARTDVAATSRTACRARAWVLKLVHELPVSTRRAEERAAACAGDEGG